MSEIQMIRNNTLRKFDYITRSHVNCIRLRKCNNANDYEHERVKIEVCFDLFKSGIDFLTEAKLIDSKEIADVVALDLNQVIEIPITETKESLDKKEKICKSYDLNFEIKGD